MRTTSSTRSASNVRSEGSPKWIRARIGGTMVADSHRARIVYHGSVPRSYAVPIEDVRLELVENEGEPEADDVLGMVRVADVEVEGRRIRGAFRIVEANGSADPDLAAHAVLDFDAFDAIYEEDEEVSVHPRDPHHRIDVLQSSRHVVIEVDGIRVAESRRPTLLFETGLPVRCYLPHADVRLDLLRDSAKQTGCPYKGWAKYSHVEVDGVRHEDLVWTYKTPFIEVSAIRGLLAFFDERVDVTVDGERQERPGTVWSPERE